MAELPLLLINVPAIVADTAHMSAAEFGGYHRILYAIWLHGGKIPHNPTALRQIAGLTPSHWAKSRDVICAPLTIAGGYVSQKRLTDTLLRTRETRRKRAAAGARRWNKSQDANLRPKVTFFPLHKPLKELEPE